MNEVKDGIYICKINKIGQKLSSTGKEMMYIEFEITDENSENFGNKFYMNQFVNTSFGIHLAKDFLKSLESSVEVEFQKADEILEIGKRIVEATKLMEFDIEQTTENNVFKKYKVLGIYDLVEI